MERFKELVTFVDVADRGSFAAAAAEEGVTPAIVGRRIDALEKRLGARLLHRSTRRLTLTEDGGVFLEHCRRVLSDLEHQCLKRFRRHVVRLENLVGAIRILLDLDRHLAGLARACVLVIASVLPFV